MKHPILVVMVAGLSASHSLAIPLPSPSTPVTGTAHKAPAERSVQVRLAAPIAVDFKEIALREALEHVLALAGLTAEVRWDDATDGLDSRVQVSLKADAMPAADVIQRLLDLAPSDSAAAAPTWQVRGGVLEIGPRTWLNRFKRTEVYDVADLVREEYEFAQAPEIDLSAVLQSAAGSGAASILREQNAAGPMTREKRTAERLATLAGLVTQTVEPEQWDVNGGPSTLLVYRNALVVTAPEYVHRQLRASPLLR